MPMYDKRLFRDDGTVIIHLIRLVRYCSFARAIDELKNLHRGQGLEIIWRDSLKCPSVDEYIDMANKSS